MSSLLDAPKYLIRIHFRHSWASRQKYFAVLLISFLQTNFHEIRFEIFKSPGAVAFIATHLFPCKLHIMLFIWVVSTTPTIHIYMCRIGILSLFSLFTDLIKCYTFPVLFFRTCFLDLFSFLFILGRYFN